MAKPNLTSMADRWTCPYVARTQIGKFTGGLLSEKHLANLDYQGKGPAGRIRCGRKIAYPVKQLLAWLEERSTEVG